MSARRLRLTVVAPHCACIVYEDDPTEVHTPCEAHRILAERDNPPEAE